MPAKQPVNLGHIVSLGVIVAAFLVGWGTLHARVSDVEKHVDGLTPAVVELRVAVAELTVAIEAAHEGDD